MANAQPSDQLSSVAVKEAFLEMLLNRSWFLRVTKDLNQVFVREEKETGEESSLGLEIFVKVLLDVLELVVRLLQDCV